MRRIAEIARYTFIEIFRNKVYYVLLLFGAVLVFSTLLLGSLGGQERSRMIIDLGLAGMEFFALVIAVFAAVTLVLEEMESRTLYLVLTRPVARHQFLLGRFFGLLGLVTCAMAIMALAHLLLLAATHISVNRSYAVSLFFSWEKIAVITAVALAFSLFSTSTLSAVTFTFFFWVLGHLSSEIRYLAQQSSRPLLVVVCRIFYYVAPNFHMMNIRDWPTQSSLPHWLGLAALYGALYTTSCLALSILLFRKKEF